MPVVPTYESKAVLQPNNGGGSLQAVDTSKMFPSTMPDVSKASAALMAAQKRVDKTRALEAKNAAMQYVTDATYGDNGYTKLQGENALRPDEQGQGLVQRGLAGLDKHMEDFYKNHGYTTQQIDLAKRECFGVRLGYEQGMGSHVVTEEKRYEVNQVAAAKTNAINMGVLAKNGRDVALAAGNLDSIVDQEGEILGYSSEQIKAKRAEAHSQLYTGVISQAILDASKDPVNGFYRAKAIFQAHYKELDATTAVALQGKINELEATAVTAQLIDANKNINSLVTTEGANPMVLAVTNGSKTATSLLWSEMVLGNTQSTPSGEVRKYANGGYGISGLRTSDALETLKKHPELFEPGMSDKALEQLFLTDRAFNEKIGMYRMDDLCKEYGNIDKAAVAYHLGKDALSEAEAEAIKAGDSDNWLAYLKGDTTNIKRVIKKVRDSQEGVVYGADGKAVNPWEEGYIDALFPMKTDAQRRALLHKVAGGFVQRNPLQEERLMDLLRTSDIKAQQDRKRVFQQNYLKGVQAIQAGQEVPAEVMQSLPIAAQRSLEKLSSKRTIGDGTPDAQAYAYYTGNPNALADATEEQYETFIRPRMGDKAGEVDILRYSILVSRGLAMDKRFANNVAADKGEIDVRFTASRNTIETALGSAIEDYHKLSEDRQHELFVRYALATARAAQRRGQYKPGGAPLPFSEVEIAKFIRDDFNHGSDSGVIFMHLPKALWLNTTAKDVKNGIRVLANRYAYAVYGTDYPATDDMQNEVWESICHGENFKGMPTVEELLADKTNFSQEILEKCIGELKGKGLPVTSITVLNRYMATHMGRNWGYRDVRKRGFIGDFALTQSALAQEYRGVD